VAGRALQSGTRGTHGHTFANAFKAAVISFPTAWLILGKWACKTGTSQGAAGLREVHDRPDQRGQERVFVIGVNAEMRLGLKHADRFGGGSRVITSAMTDRLEGRLRSSSTKRGSA